MLGHVRSSPQPYVDGTACTTLRFAVSLYNMTLEKLNEVVAAAVRRHRERLGMSQTELARRMKQQGLPWHQVTVARTESVERPLRLDEAVILAGILRVSVGTLYRPTIEEKDDELIALTQELRNTEKQLQGVELQYESISRQYQELQRDVHGMHGAVEAARNQATKFQHEAERAAEAAETAKRTLVESEVRLMVAEDKLHDLEESRHELTSRVDQLRSRQLVRTLKPGDMIDVGIKDVEPAATRFSQVDDGVVFELVNKNGEVVLTSAPFPTRDDADAAHKYFLDTFAHRQGTSSED